MTPWITILCSQYHHEHLLPRAIDSVLAQTDHRWLLWIINDDPAIVLQPHIDSRIRIINNWRNVGQHRNYRKWIPAVETPWFTFLDADDTYSPDRLDEIRKCAEAGADVVYSNATYNGVPRETPVYDPATYWRSNYICGAASAFRTDWMWGVKYTWMHGGGDVLFFAQAAARNANIARIDKCTYHVTVGTTTLKWLFGRRYLRTLFRTFLSVRVWLILRKRGIKHKAAWI